MSYQRMKSQKQHGYTLIEVIVALAIFALLGVMSVGLLARAFDTKTRLKAHLAPLKTLELADVRIMHDTAQVVERGIGEDAAFVATPTDATFTRGGFISMDNSQSTLRRIKLACQNGQLTRQSVMLEDASTIEQADAQVLLNHLEQCSFSYLFPEKSDDDEEVSDSKHEHEKDDEKPVMPRAIKLHLVLHQLGDVTLLYAVKGEQS